MPDSPATDRGYSHLREAVDRADGKEAYCALLADADLATAARFRRWCHDRGVTCETVPGHVPGTLQVTTEWIGDAGLADELQRAWATA